MANGNIILLHAHPGDCSRTATVLARLGSLSEGLRAATLCVAFVCCMAHMSVIVKIFVVLKNAWLSSRSLYMHFVVPDGSAFECDCTNTSFFFVQLSIIIFHN